MRPFSSLLLAVLLASCSSSNTDKADTGTPGKDAAGTAPDTSVVDARAADVSPDAPGQTEAGAADAGIADGASDTAGDAALADVGADGPASGTDGSSDAGTVAALLPLENAWPFGGAYDTAVVWNNGFAYFFKGDEYIKYNVTTGGTTAPLAAATYWPGWPAAFAGGINAATLWSGGKAYFFKGSQYARYDVAADRFDDGFPQDIATALQGLPDAFNAGIDAAALWDNGKVYLFKGTEYVRLDPLTNVMDPGYPNQTVTYWPGYPAGWARTTSVLVWPGGKAFFKSGNEYIRYDVDADRADPGYPRPFR
jgi:hypothetical protein